MSNWFYRFGRALLNQSVSLYYRRIEVAGAERIPENGPAIIVANHPNSVADAFLVAARLTPRKINFIAKDTITGAPVVGWLVRQFGVVGVARAYEYERQRDMARQRNEAAIGTCIPRLLAGEVVVIFGEGISTDLRRLHMIRKGAMRFGYAAERAAGFQLGLKWIPVGINYSAKERFRSDVALRIGEPFALSDIHADAVESQQIVVRAVEFFNTVEPQRLAELEKQLTGYDRRLAATGLSDDVIRQRRPQQAMGSHLQGVMLNGVLLLLNLYGLLNSFLPRWAAAAAAWMQSLFAAGDTGPGGHPTALTKEALWATLGGWVGSAIAFPLQTYLVYGVAESAWGRRSAVVLAVLYALSLLPSWWLFVRRRDIFREHLTNLRNAVRFLASAQSAGRLRVHRRRLERQARTLVADYQAAGPRAA